MGHLDEVLKSGPPLPLFADSEDVKRTGFNYDEVDTSIQRCATRRTRSTERDNGRREYHDIEANLLIFLLMAIIAAIAIAAASVYDFVAVRQCNSFRYSN